MNSFRPTINDKHTDRLIGDGPSLTMAMQQDAELQNLKFQVIDDIKKNFTNIQLFLRRLDDIQAFYSENCLMKPEAILHEKSRWELIVS